MATIDNISELRLAVRNAAEGKRDLKLAAEACERMDKEREAMRQKQGEVNIAVELLRETREEE